MHKSQNFVRNFEKILRNSQYFNRESFKNFTNSTIFSSEAQLNADKNVNIKETVVKPFEHEDFFDVKSMVTVEKLFNARAHYGHHIGLRNPWMTDYIFGTRLNTDIIDLEKTCKLFQDALNIVAHIAFKNGIILFITRDAAQIPKVENTARDCGEYAHCRKWFSGTFTDSIKRYQSVVRLPDLCIFLNTNDSFSEQHGAVVESAKMLIPSVAIVDTNTDPNLITYPIPGNDDSAQSVDLYCQLFKETIIKAKAKRKQLADAGIEISYEN